MAYFFSVLYVELLKVRKSKVIWIVAAAFSIAPIMGGFFMFVLKHPELAMNSGLVGAKAQIAGEATWPAFLNLLAQMIAVGGILIFGFVASWIFGREYADGTIKDLLALPVSREMIVWAKIITIFITNLVICFYILSIGFLIGWFVVLPGWSSEVISHGLFIITITAFLTIVISTPVAFFASFGRGYLAPLGFVIAMVVLSQLIAAAGHGAYFPWAVPALFSGMTGEENGLPFLSFVIIFMTGIAGVVATLVWWAHADEH